MKVLLVEPDKKLGQQYLAALSEHETTHVQDAQHAITAIDDVLPDVILLELLLGSHNGLEFLYELRSYADAQTIPVILHTFVDHPQFTSDETLLAELGIVEYLYKPATTLSQLERAINRIMSKDSRAAT